MKYLTIPYQFDAVQFDGTQNSADAIAEFAGPCSINNEGNLSIIIFTVPPSYWVIRRAQDAPFVMSDSQFRASFTPAS